MCPMCLDKKVIIYGSDTIAGQETIPCECVRNKGEVKGAAVFSQEESNVTA